MEDSERLRRTRQRDVELAQPGVSALVDDQRRLDDDDVVELESLRLPGRQHRNGALVERLAVRAAREGTRSDHGDETVLLGGFQQRRVEELARADAHELRRGAALPEGE